MTKDDFLMLCRMLKLICNKSSNKDVKYQVLQLSKLFGNVEFIEKLARFYNFGWTGNNDFIHIPNVDQIIDNMFKHPIIVATDKNGEILGVSTLKCECNNDYKLDPYFPYNDIKYLSITGILAKKDNEIKGVGKKIYEIALIGSYLFNQINPDVKLMCVIDCRNKFSLEAAKMATRYANIQYGLPITASITGYYEVRSEETEKLLESPTFVLEFLMKNKEKLLQKNMSFEYLTTDFNEHLSVLQSVSGLENISKLVRNYDDGVGNVDYFEFNKKIDVNYVNVNPGFSYFGNDREIVDMEYFHDGEEKIDDIPNYVKRRTLERCMIRR